MIHIPGSLVAARGREWVVLPESTDDLLVRQPLGGADREIAGIYLPLEGADVRPAARRSMTRFTITRCLTRSCASARASAA